MQFSGAASHAMPIRHTAHPAFGSVTWITLSIGWNHGTTLISHPTGFGTLESKFTLDTEASVVRGQPPLKVFILLPHPAWVL